MTLHRNYFTLPTASIEAHFSTFQLEEQPTTMTKTAVWICKDCNRRHTNPTTHHCPKRLKLSPQPQPITSKLAVIAGLMDNFVREENDARANIIEGLTDSLNEERLNTATANRELMETHNELAETITYAEQLEVTLTRQTNVIARINEANNQLEERLNRMASQILSISRGTYCIERDTAGIPVRAFKMNNDLRALLDSETEEEDLLDPRDTDA